nr:hypothetical protein BaRGS_019554 [Batillaria attramentaria]
MLGIDHHVNHDNMEYALQMEIWKGNITGAIQLARERGQLSDWIVSLAPLASYEVWLSVCEEYADQLEEEGQYHKAVSYLLACHKLYPAIDLFRRHKLFREAVALARVRLSPLDPVLEDLYTYWSEQLMRDGAYEQAAKCYLAMKHIQDAAKVIARRCDQTSLQAACHMTLLADEKQQGQLYAQQVVTRYLAAQQWSQALAFLKEHQPLKVFVPYVSVHEMVLRELATMVPDIVPSIDTDSSETWGNTPVPADRLGIPEFILDPNEADPVLPWELHLVDGHAFPHHMLRMWHLHLEVTMETEQLHLVYHALQQLQSGRQTHLDTQQVLLQVCADITLWLLALLTNQTSLAISHLLAALSTLHEGGHLTLLTAICRLLLPLGPKYMLKLQQEVSALRVLINMESHVDVEGGGKHLSLRRYLSELKDEPSVSTGALRCRQLDCVRAYFYLSVLHHLQQSYATQSDDACRPETSVNSNGMTSSGTSCTDSVSEKPSSPGSRNTEVAGKCETNDTDVDGKQSERVDRGGGSVKAKPVARDVGSADGGADAKTDARNRGSGKDGDGGCTDGGDRNHNMNSVPLKKGGCGVGEGESDVDGRSVSKKEKSSPGSPAKRAGSASVSPQKQSPDKSGVSGRDSAKDSEQRRSTTSESDDSWHLSLPRLLQLSKGLLWDLQAKRLALTDTLGYIHRAISQHLLTDRSREVAKTLSRHTPVGSLHNHNHNHAHTAALHNHYTHAPVLPDTVAAHLPDDPFLDIEDGTTISMQTEESIYTTASAVAGATAADNQVDSENRKTSSASLQSSSSSSVMPGVPLLRTDSAGTPPSVANQPAVPNLGALPESNFDLDLATLGQPWDGSRRVLWEDDPLTGSGRGGEGHRVAGDGSSHKPTCLLSPAKYINVPDEWYSLPVDEKYGRTYVTLAILKDEQEFVMSELKRMSDSSQVPFPNPINSIELLLDVCLANVAMPTEDKHNYIKSLQSWALHFAVTSQQRSQADSLFARAEKEIGL